MVKRRAAVAETLRRRVYSGLHLGLLRAGDRLPSLRELARELGADPRVILGAFRELEKDGLVEVRQRSGIYVASLTASELKMRRRSDWVVRLLVEGLERGVPAPTLPGRIRQCLETISLGAACIECNADQIASLSGELRSDYGLETVGVETDLLTQGRSLPPELERADLLVTTLFHKPLVEPLAVRLGKPWIVVTLRPDLFEEITRRVKEAPAYVVVADPRFAAKLPLLFASTEGANRIQPVTVGSDDVDRIPRDAPTYLTRLARQQLGECTLTARVKPVERVFSAETARQIFSLIVRANLEALDGAGRDAPSL